MNRAPVLALWRTVCLAVVLVCSLTFAVKANAQWLPDRQYSEGPGFRVGELELHPGIALRGGYDSNVFKADGKTRDGVKQPIQDAAILAVTPHLYLTTETAQRASQGEDKPAPAPRFLGFKAGLAATYVHYFVDNAPRNVAIDTDVFLGIAQGRPVGLDVALGYLRSVAPFTQDAQRRNAYVYDIFDPKVRFKFSSRSQVFSAYAGYAPKYTHYESSVFDYLNNIQHGIETGAAWKFLPHTALVYDGSLGLQDYRKLTNGTEQLLLYSDGRQLRTRLGLNGALTNTIGLRLLAGYGAVVLKQAALDDKETVVGEAAMTFTFGQHGLELGYQRDLVVSALGGWYQTDRGFAKLGFLIARRLRLSIDGGVGQAIYGKMLRVNTDGDIVGLGANESTKRKDIRVDGGLHAEYRVTNWLSFMADYVIQTIITDFEYDTTTADNRAVPDPAGFLAMQVFGGVRFSY